ncbi:hypothetical protein [Mycobacterium colombiense]|uniref:hypothetical protein n=1 Tax=Mycobacterium colombiense TaxID=339268 RepID=UPI00096E5A6E|nr:hypothetical protein [Mycobacterium colombiense]OMB91098.1 hypothetical protein A5732_22590 [Mycobacterium colombiense]OMC25440.1 hypothetical protein A5737_15690 [Mycobacterium colombiense]
MTVMQRPAAGLSAVREVAFPLVAVAIIVASTDIRIPLGLPGHRGLIWLTMLVAVVLVTARRETVLAVGVAASIAALPMHGLSDPLWSSRYVSAAALLYAVASLPVMRVRRWLLAVAAAPIHLVALASSGFSWHSGAVMSAWTSNGMLERAGWHLVFGFVAGLLAWVVALGLGRPPSGRAGAFLVGSRYKERPL